MKFLNRKSPNKILWLCFVCIWSLIFSNCSLKISENPGYDAYQNEQQIQLISSLEVKSNIIIKSNNEEGKLFAGFNYTFPDTLKIQFRDPIGRKQALMTFNEEHFLLWLQRENKKYKRDEIPTEFSLFVFQELDLSNIRKLFLGRPLFDIDKKSSKKLIEKTENDLNDNILITTYFNGDKTIRRVEVAKNNEVATIVVYSNWNVHSNIYFPENIQIIDLNTNVELQIKLYHYSPEYFKLSSL